MPKELNFLSQLTGSFALAAAGNATIAMIDTAYPHHGLDWRYINCEVTPERLGDAVRGAWAMGCAGFNCSPPHKVAVIEHLDGLGESAAIMRAVNCAVRRGDKYVGGRKAIVAYHSRSLASKSKGVRNAVRVTPIGRSLPNRGIASRC